MSWFYPKYWADENAFLKELRRKLPIIPNSGGGISVTTTGTNGAATLIGTVLNIPVYSSNLTPSQLTLQYAAPGDVYSQILFKDSGGGLVGEIRFTQAGTYSTFVGINAGKLNTGALNTAIGVNSLNANVSGIRNIAIGGGMQGSQANSNNNIAIGLDALDTDVSALGDGNIVIGNNTLDLGDPVGTSNVFLGAFVNNSIGGPIGDYNLMIGKANMGGTLSNTGVFLPGLGNGTNLVTVSNVIVIGDNSQNTILGTDFQVFPTPIVDNGSRLQINGGFYLSITAAPGSPVDGQFWREDNSITGLKMRQGGVTRTVTLT